MELVGVGPGERGESLALLMEATQARGCRDSRGWRKMRM